MSTIKALNSADETRAIALIEPLIERAPEIAPKVIRHRPFDGVDDIVKAIGQELQSLSEADRIALFRAHPELAPENPLAMTEASQSEQGRLNLTSAKNEYHARLAELNAKYLSNFGFPFIIALVRHQDMQSVLSEFEVRLAEDRDAEIEEALRQVKIVSSARVQEAFGQNSLSAPR